MNPLIVRAEAAGPPAPAPLLYLSGTLDEWVGWKRKRAVYGSAVRRLLPKRPLTRGRMAYGRLFWKGSDTNPEHLGVSVARRQGPSLQMVCHRVRDRRRKRRSTVGISSSYGIP